VRVRAGGRKRAERGHQRARPLKVLYVVWTWTLTIKELLLHFSSDSFPPFAYPHFYNRCGLRSFPFGWIRSPGEAESWGLDEERRLAIVEMIRPVCGAASSVGSSPRRQWSNGGMRSITSGLLCVGTSNLSLHEIKNHSSRRWSLTPWVYHWLNIDTMREIESCNYLYIRRILVNVYNSINSDMISCWRILAAVAVHYWYSSGCSFSCQPDWEWHIMSWNFRNQSVLDTFLEHIIKAGKFHLLSPFDKSLEFNLLKH